MKQNIKKILTCYRRTYPVGFGSLKKVVLEDGLVWNLLKPVSCSCHETETTE